VHLARRGDDVRLDLVVGGRDEVNAEIPPCGDAVRCLAEGEPVSQKRCAGEVRADVEVAEGEPRPADAVGAQFAADPLALAHPAPAALLVVLAGERVHDRVEVGGDAQPTQPHVVADVDDGGDLGAFRRRCAQAAQEPGAANAAAEHRDLH